MDPLNSHETEIDSSGDIVSSSARKRLVGEYARDQAERMEGRKKKQEKERLLKKKKEKQRKERKEKGRQAGTSSSSARPSSQDSSAQDEVTAGASENTSVENAISTRVSSLPLGADGEEENLLQISSQNPEVEIGEEGEEEEQEDRQARVMEPERRRNRGRLGEDARGEIMSKKFEVAAMGVAGYIALPKNYSQFGTMMDWTKAAADALGGKPHKRKNIVSVSPYRDPTATRDGNDGTPRRCPALIVFFINEAKLEAALKPIEIMGYETEVKRFTAGNQPCVFIVESGVWVHHPELIKQPFEAQAVAKVTGWGWQIKHGLKIALLLQTDGVPGRNLRKVNVASWQLKCVRAPEEGCCCCGKNHNCFIEGSGCKYFLPRYRY